MQQFELGQFANLRNWLKDNIHIHGQKYRANKLAEKVTGKGISYMPLMDYMNAKYSEIYGF